MAKPGEYKLSKMVKCHTDSVRDMFLYSDATGSPKLVTVSRDCDAKIYAIIDGTVSDRAELTFSDSVAMSSVTVMPQSGGMVPMLFFGCMNGAIFVHLDKETTPLNVLTFHSSNVGALRVDAATKLLATGSWDNSAIVYDTAKESVRFKIFSHTQAVNDVEFLHPRLASGGLCLLTASSDKSIILWDISSTDIEGASPPQLRTFMGHEDCVRSIYVLPTEQDSFYSVSNDQLIKCWNLSNGYELQTLVGHQHFIYKIARLGAGKFMTCGEDTTIRIWDQVQAQELQCITLPVVSIWNLIALNEQTLIVACSDGRIYILSNDPARAATADAMLSFDQLIANQKSIPFAEVVHLKLYEQYSLDSIPASSPHEKRLVRMIEDDSVVVFEHDGEKGSWKPLGKVSEYIHHEDLDKNGRVFFNGDYYDDVVEVKLHGIKYRLAYNRNLDPWLVASDFVAFHHLESTDLQPVVRALVTQVKYEPKREGKDAFSDASEYPMFKVVLFDQPPPNWENFKQKFQEFNDSMPGEEMKLDSATFQMVCAEFNDPSRNCGLFVLCYQKLFKWPAKKRFLVYDLLRLNLTNAYFASYTLHHYPHFDSLLESLLADTKEADSALQLTALRSLANLFSTVHGAEYMYHQFPLIQQSIVSWHALVDNRNVHIAYATLWYNYSILPCADPKKRFDANFLNCLMGIIADIEGAQKKHAESVGQLLHAFANLLSLGAELPWADNGNLVKDFRKRVQDYPKLFEACYEVKRAVQQINRL